MEPTNNTGNIAGYDPLLFRDKLRRRLGSITAGFPAGRDYTTADPEDQKDPTKGSAI